MQTAQISFDPLDYVSELYDLAEAHKVAKFTRDRKLRALRKAGRDVKGWVLTGQLRPYASFGVPDGRVRNVYYINDYTKEE